MGKKIHTLPPYDPDDEVEMSAKGGKPSDTPGLVLVASRTDSRDFAPLFETAALYSIKEEAAPTADKRKESAQEKNQRNAPVAVLDKEWKRKKK